MTEIELKTIEKLLQLTRKKDKRKGAKIQMQGGSWRGRKMHNKAIAGYRSQQ